MSKCIGCGYRGSMPTHTRDYDFLGNPDTVVHTDFRVCPRCGAEAVVLPNLSDLCDLVGRQESKPKPIRIERVGEAWRVTG